MNRMTQLLSTTVATLALLAMGFVPAADASSPVPSCPPESGVWITVCSNTTGRSVNLYRADTTPEYEEICVTTNLCVDVPRPLTLVDPYTTTVYVTIVTVGVNTRQIVADVCGIIDPNVCSVTTAARVDPNGALVHGLLVETQEEALFLDFNVQP